MWRPALFCVVAIFVTRGFGQCPFPAALISTGNACLQKDTLVVNSSHTLTSITWLYNGAITATLSAHIVTKPLQNATTVAGGNGSGASLRQFNNPSSLFVDATSYLYVADRSNYRIMKFPPGSTSATDGIVVAGGNGPGKSLNQFQPNAIFVDADGILYVADDGNSRVLRFPPNSNSTTIGSIAAGGNGAGKAANQLVNPVGLFVDAVKNLYIVDAFNDRIQKFPPNSTGSTDAITVAGGNGYGDKANQFNGPAAVFVNKDGYIYVDDAANNRIQKFPPNATSATAGTTIAGGNSFGAAANQLSTPSSLWGDETGNIYVADINNQRIQLFPPGSASYTPGVTIAGGNGQGAAANQFSGPNAVWGDNKGNLFVSDIGNNRVQKFSLQPIKQYLIDTTLPASQTGTYAAILTDTLGCSVITNTIVVNPAVHPSVTISASPITVVPCAEATASYHFAATAANGGALPIYQWQINGINTGSNSPFLTAEVTNGDVVSCSLVSNAACASPSNIKSEPLTVSFAAKPIVSLQNKGRLCAGLDTLYLSSGRSLTAITWYRNGVQDTVINSITTPNGTSLDTTYHPLTEGSYFAIATSGYGCTNTTKTIQVEPTLTPEITISANKEELCAGETVTFKADGTNAGAVPFYQWLVNNKTAGVGSASYSSSSLQNNDIISCVLQGDTTGCFGIDTSNRIIPIVHPVPTFSHTQDISISLGQSVVLSPSFTGDVVQYNWQPSSTLSNASASHPLATPLHTTVYVVRAISADGCAATDSIKVIISSPVLIPSAFSPNGDGLNDQWYIRGGNAGDAIQSVHIHNRHGEAVFIARNVQVNDRKGSWDGTFRDKPQPVGTYVYEVIISSSGNTQKLYTGSVVLVR